MEDPAALPDVPQTEPSQPITDQALPDVPQTEPSQPITDHLPDVPAHEPKVSLACFALSHNTTVLLVIACCHRCQTSNTIIVRTVSQSVI